MLGTCGLLGMDFEMKREMRILGDESPSAEPPGHPLDTLGPFRCGGEESGGGGAGQEGEKWAGSWSQRLGLCGRMLKVVVGKQPRGSLACVPC